MRATRKLKKIFTTKGTAIVMSGLLIAGGAFTTYGVYSVRAAESTEAEQSAETKSEQFFMGGGQPPQMTGGMTQNGQLPQMGTSQDRRSGALSPYIDRAMQLGILEMPQMNGEQSTQTSSETTEMNGQQPPQMNGQSDR